MDLRQSVKSNVRYGKELVEAGWDGVAGEREELAAPEGVWGWTPVAIGAAAGLIAADLAAERRSASRLAAGLVAGAAVGIGVALAWASRGFFTAAARGAASRVNATRDAHWLTENPIDYA